MARRTVSAPLAPVERRRPTPRRKVAAPSAVAARNPELEAQIGEVLAAGRDDAGAHLVYADWLQLQGDPRGQLAVAQHQLSLEPDDTERVAAEERLMTKHRALFMPPMLGKILATVRRTTPTADRPEVRWRHGYINHATLARRTYGRPYIGEVLNELLAHPSGVFLRSLTLARVASGVGGDYLTELQALIDAGPVHLQELVIGMPTDPVELSQRSANDIAALLPALPALRRLVVRARLVELETPFAHDHLRELELVVHGQTSEELVRVVSGSFPALESLTLELVECELDAHVRRCLLTNPSLGKLRRLALRRTRQTATWIQAIAGSALVGSLVELDLRDGDLVDGDADGLARLRELGPVVLDGNPLGGSAVVTISVADARDRAEDETSIDAAHEIARWRRWSMLGRDGDRVWGLYVGSNGTYSVFASLVARESGCTCASDRRPCKHALALLFLAASGHAFRPRPLPPEVARAARAERID